MNTLIDYACIDLTCIIDAGNKAIIEDEAAIDALFHAMMQRIIKYFIARNVLSYFILNKTVGILYERLPFLLYLTKIELLFL